MPFIPQLSSSFSSLDDPDLRTFLENICDKRKVRSFAKKAKAESKSLQSLQVFQDRHYLELVVLSLLSRKEAKSLLRLPDEQLVTDSIFEGAEFLSVLRDVYRQLPADKRSYVKGRFNSGFDGVMGMIPLAHEMNVARALDRSGFEVEFAEYGGTASYDFSVRKGCITAQIDCKACGGDNGKVIKLSASGAIFAHIAKSIRPNDKIFDGQILCLSIVDRANIPQNVPLVAKRAVDNLRGRSSATQIDGVAAELFPFDSHIASQIKDIAPVRDNDQSIVSLIRDSIKETKSDWSPFVEWVFLSPQGLDALRFACLLCSPESVDWRKNAFKVVQQSLLGQLKNSQCPAIFLRYSDLSDNEISTGWFTETRILADVTLVNPLDELFHEIVNDFIGRKLCAMFFQHRPRFKESSILGLNGTPHTIGSYGIRSYYNSSHSCSDALRASVSWHD